MSAIRSAVRRTAAAILPVLFALLVSGQVSPAPQQSHGRISGTVLYPDGTPVSDGKVFLSGARDHENPDELTAETDESGRFEFKHLRFTSYWFNAEKEDEAYGEAETVSVRGGARLVHPDGVEITARAPSAHVTLKLKPKWGILTGVIVDRTTHQSVTARFRFQEEIGTSNVDGHRFLHGFFTRQETASFRILIPPSPPLFLEVDADGYKPWFYAGTSSQSSLPLRLASGEQLSQTIELEPETKVR